MRDARYTLFYDGHCALCHGAVRFVVKHDKRDSVIRFAPLHGALFAELIPETRRGALPDSIVVLTEDGRLLTRSAAVVHLLKAVGGAWALLAGFARVLPTALLDAAYDGIAKVRYRIFGTRDETCPVIPESLRAKFDMRA